MTAAIIIPARYSSTRFPGKPLVLLTGSTGLKKSLVQRSWEAACAVPGIEQVLIATDDARIADAARAFGAKIDMTPAACANGSERCAAAAEGLDDAVDIVVNLQGDAPLTPPGAVTALLDALAAERSVQVATPAIRATPAVHARLLDDQRQGRVGGTTVVTDATGNALYFSKAVLPHVPAGRIGDAKLPVALHIGVYAYRRAALAAYAARTASALEELEGLEQLRFLDAGIPVRVVPIAPADVWELNHPGDVAVIEAALMARGIA